jgi:mono/diheme cytochrome c family protein
MTLPAAAAAICLVTAAAADDTRLSAAEARKLKSPVPYTKKSIDRGRLVYSQNCTGCHGTDGKAELAVIAEATDLTSPTLYKNGTTEGEIFRSIRDGAGDQMPPFKSQIDKEDDIWQLVNFVRSLWPAAVRPRLQEDKGY